VNKERNHTNRPPGISSKIRQADGLQSKWVAANGQAVRLPLIVDHINTDPKSSIRIWCVEARIDLVGDNPELTEVKLKGNPHLNTIHLQRFFRWATPIEIVRVTVPTLLEKGVDPFKYDFSTEGYPDSANIERKPTTRLSDDFLWEIARQYVEIGHGYACVIAQQRGVSKRTVISWVEKARKRGILGPTTRGRRNRRLASLSRLNNTD
jgi:hypothetical protein